MQKIGSSTTTANAAGEYTEGNPGAGVDATLITAMWLNTIQRELVNLIQGASLTLNPADDSQVFKAVQALQTAMSTWSKITEKPTTVAGYGITDAFTKPETTAAIQAAVSALVASSPAALDTLKELAAALGNDANFATTMTNALAGKANKSTTLAGYGIADAFTKTQVTASIDDLSESLFAALPKYYLTGFELSINAGSPQSTIDLAPGWARVAGNPVALTVKMSGVLQAAGAWSAGSGGNKLDTGGRAANAWYHVFVIRRIADGAADMLFSLSLTAAAVPAGYELIRRIASVKTDASGGVVPFINAGRHFWWATPIKDVSSSAPASSAGTLGAATLALSVPPGVRTKVMTHVAISSIAAWAYMRPTDASAITMALVVGAIPGWLAGIGMNTSDVDYMAFPFECLTDTAASVVLQWIIASGSGTGYYAVSTLGYIEF